MYKYLYVYKYLMEGSKEDGDQLLSVVPTDWASNYVHSLKPRKFCLNISGKKLICEEWSNATSYPEIV